MASSAQEAAHAAATLLKNETGRNTTIAPAAELATESLADTNTHVAALYRLLMFCAGLCEGDLHVVVRTDIPNLLNVRGTGMPTWTEGLPPDKADQLAAVSHALEQARAILLRDNGGFAVLYESAG